MRNSKFCWMALPLALALGLILSLLMAPGVAIAAAKEVRIGYWSSGTSGGLGTVIEEKKFIENEGVNVKWVRFAKLAEVGRAMMANSIDATPSDGILQVRRRIQEGEPSRIIMANMVADEYFVAKEDSPIKKMEDLKGKKVGVGPPASVSHAISVAILEKGLGFKPTDYEKAPVAGQQSLALLEKGDIQAASLRSIELARARKELKLIVLGSFKDLWPKVTGFKTLPILGIMTVNVNFDKENPELIDKVAKGVIKAYEWGGKNKDEVAKILIKYLNMPEENAKDYADQWNNIYLASLSDEAIEGLTKEAEFFVSLGNIKSVPPKDALFLSRPYKNAISK